MRELTDIASERSLVRLLLEESCAMGASVGREILDRCALVPEDFSDPVARAVWYCASRCLRSGTTPVLPTMLPLVLSQSGGRLTAEQVREFLSGDSVLNAVNAETYSHSISERSTLRRIRRAVQRINAAVDDEAASPVNLLAMFASESRAIPTRSSNWESLADVLDRVETGIRERSEGGREPNVPTGFRELDQLSGGLPPTLVVMLAMPGVGKSAVLASWLRHAASLGFTSATFSMEDRGEWLAYRLLAHDSGVRQFVLRNKILSGAQWQDVGDGLNRSRAYAGRILLDDRPGLRASEVLYAARHAVTELGAKFIALDNMTAMRFHRGQRMDLEIQDFLCDARALADELKVPFLVLSHVKRRDGLEPGDMPRLTDASETSAFEKLCRVAYALARAPNSDKLTIRVLKNTNGKLGAVEMPFAADSALVLDGVAPVREPGEDRECA